MTKEAPLFFRLTSCLGVTESEEDRRYRDHLLQSARNAAEETAIAYRDLLVYERKITGSTSLKEIDAMVAAQGVIGATNAANSLSEATRQKFAGMEADNRVSVPRISVFSLGLMHFPLAFSKTSPTLTGAIGRYTLRIRLWSWTG